MKVGDLIGKKRNGAGIASTGVVVEFVPCAHAKQHPKVTVLTENGLENWLIQFCEVVDEE